MDVGLSLLGWLDLDDQVNVGDVKTTGSNISGNEDSEFSFLEALHCDFTLVLCNVAVHDLDVLLNFIGEEQGVCIGLRLGEHDHFATFAVDYKDVGQGGETVLEWALNSQVSHITCSLVLELDSQVNDAYTLLHMRSGDISHPSGDGG